jgi:hypothetical protein
MKITQESIEALGFNFKVKADDNTDYTFNKPSNRENWVDLLVWQPDTNEITLSQHTNDVFRLASLHRLPRGKKITDYVVQLSQSNVKSVGELKTILENHNII